jgi:hypothetical protein
MHQYVDHGGTLEELAVISGARPDTLRRWYEHAPQFVSVELARPILAMPIPGIGATRESVFTCRANRIVDALPQLLLHAATHGMRIIGEPSWTFDDWLPNGAVAKTAAATATFKWRPKKGNQHA